jgi:plastocyanin
MLIVRRVPRGAALSGGACLLAVCVHVAACSEVPAAKNAPPAPVASAASNTTATSVVTGQAAPSSIIELEPMGVDLPQPEGPVIMDQYGKAFVPETLHARAGQTVEFRNSEDIDHNIQVLRRPTGTTVMNESGSQGEIFRRTFEPGVYDVICDVHPGMRGIIIASRSPYVAIADDRGRFELTSIPPGRYTVRVTDRGGVKTQMVDVQAPRTSVPAER